MNALQTSARFAAYMWFINQPENHDQPREAAHQFARLNWERFLPNAHAGFGRLLLRMAAPPEKARRTRLRPRMPALTAAG